jgi:hypothetical protein
MQGRLQRRFRSLREGAESHRNRDKMGILRLSAEVVIPKRETACNGAQLSAYPRAAIALIQTLSLVMTIIRI